MHRPRKHLIVAAVLLLAGAVRVPWEISLTRELRAASLLPEPLPLSVGEKIGQTSSAVALGGLRTLVATFLNLRAYTAFTDGRAQDLEENYNLIVDLAPRGSYYWESGAWHLAYNASSWFQNDETLPALRRRELWRTYITKGRAFLERGIRNNPDDWKLQAELGRLLSDRHKAAAFPDRQKTLSEAAAAYHEAALNGGRAYTERNQFYLLSRLPDRRAEALALGETLYQKSRSHHTPTFLGLLFSLRMAANPSLPARDLAVELCGDPRRAHRILAMIWEDRASGFPVDGIAQAITGLEAELSIPPSESPLKKH